MHNSIKTVWFQIAMFVISYFEALDDKYLGLSKKETCIRGRGRGRSAEIMNFL